MNETLVRILLLVLGFLGGLFSPIRISFGTLRNPTQEDFEEIAARSAHEKEKYAELEVVASMIARGAEADEVLDAMTSETRREFEAYKPKIMKVKKED